VTGSVAVGDGSWTDDKLLSYIDLGGALSNWALYRWLSRDT
jgi:hypothetical protein